MELRATGPRHVRVGLTLDLPNPTGTAAGAVEAYRQGLRRARRAEALGYDVVWASEHHFEPSGYCPSLLPLAGAVLGQTTTLRYSTYVFLLPLHHPVRVAEDVAVLDVLSGGRMELGVGMGYRAEEFAGLGIDHRRRTSLMDECCDILLRCWTAEGWSHDGQHFDLDDVRLRPRPVQEPHPRLWVSARTPSAARRAARCRAGLLLPPPSFVDDEVSVHRAYADALRDEGVEPDDPCIGVAAYLTPVVTDDATPRPSRAGRSNRAAVLERWAATTLDPPTAPGRRAGRRPSAVVGDAATCLRAIQDLLDGPLPITDLVMGIEDDVAVERFAREVLPHLRAGVPDVGAPG